MDPQTLQVIKDAATVIQALLDERNQLQQQMAETQQPQQQQQWQQQQPAEQPQKTAAIYSEQRYNGFTRPVQQEFSKSAQSEDDAVAKYNAGQSELFEMYNLR